MVAIELFPNDTEWHQTIKVSRENVKSFESQTLNHIFCTQDAISKSFHLLLRLFIFNVNVSNSKIMHRHISGSREVCVPRAGEWAVRRGVKLSLSTLMWETQLSGPHGNIQ